MRYRCALIVAVCCGLAGCGSVSAATSTATSPNANSAPTATLAAAALDELRAANDRATSEICPLLSPEAVAASFDENGPLTTQPMVEGRGPACGFPHPRHGGYLLVVQFQALAEWDQHLAKGQRVDGLGYPARIETAGPGASLHVLDGGRHAVVMYLAPDSDHAVAALLRVAAHVYGVTASQLVVSTA